MYKFLCFLSDFVDTHDVSPWRKILATLLPSRGDSVGIWQRWYVLGKLECLGYYMLKKV